MDTMHYRVIQGLLRRFGIEEKEQAAFLILLELGPQPASIVARYLGVPRSTMYMLLQQLMDRNLVEEFVRAGVKYFRCVSPAGIADVLRAQEKQILQTLAVLKQTFPLLSAFAQRPSVVPIVKFLDGRPALGRLYESILREREFVSAFDPAQLKQTMPEYYPLLPEAVARNSGKARLLLVDSEEAREYQRMHRSASLQIKILPAHMVFHSDTFIAGSRVCHVSYGECRPWGMDIASGSLSRLIQMVFDEFWATLP